MRQKLISWAAIILPTFIFLSFPPPAFAVTFSISTSQQSISKDDSIEIDVSISGLTSCDKCYLQAAFTNSLSNPKYLGYTEDNAGGWYKYLSSPPPDVVQSSFFSFTPENNSWSGTIKAKIDTADSDYKGADQYYLKVARYTGKSTSGSSSWADNSIVINVIDDVPTQTPIPISSPTPIKTPTPKPTSKSTATPKPVATSTATSIPTVKASFSPTPEIEDNAPTSILGEMVTASPSASPTIAEAKEASFFDFPKLVMGAGVVFVAASGILAFRRFHEKDNLN